MAYVHNNLFKSNSGFEHRLDRQRTMDDRRNVTIRYLKDDNRAQLSNTFLDRSDAYRRRREADEQAKEASLLEDIQRREKIREAFKLSREEDDFIAKQLSDQDKEYQREQRVLEKLRLESPELRALQTKLQIAEMNKLRHQQLEEKRLMELEEAARNAGFHKLMELQMIKEDALEHERLRKRFGNMMDAKQRIQEQLKEREIIKEQELQERLKETEELTEELAKLREEQITEAYRKLRKKAQVRQTMVEGQKVREEMKRKKERQEKEEEDAIMAYRAKIEERLRMQDVGKKEKRDEEQRIHNELSAKTLAEMRAKEDMENAINDYYFEESEALYHKKMEELRIQKERIQANLRAACQMHEQFKEERRQQERLDKKEFARRMLESMEKEFKLEQLSAQRRRMKIEEYKREIDQAWLEKESAFQSQLEEANERRRKEEEEARWREALVERERKKLLAEHAVKLADYLPKGTLSKPEDLTIVGIKSSPEDTSVGKPYRPF